MTELPTTAIPLGARDALRVEQGEVLVFVARRTARGLGRWVQLARVLGPATVIGADVDGAVVVASPLPESRCWAVSVADLSDADRDSALAPADDAVARLERADHERADKSRADELQDEHDAWVVRDALTDLANAVPGHIEPAGDAAASEDVAVMAHLAMLVGLPADPIRLRRALTDAQVSGRDRLAALTAACDASARRVELPPDWWQAAGPPLLVTMAADGRHAVAAWSRGAYRAWTPESGSPVRIDASSAQRLESAALLLQPLLDPSRAATLRDLVRLGTRGSGRSVALVLAMSAVVGVLSGVIPVVSGRVTTAVATQSDTSLWTVAVALVLLVIALTMLRAVRTFAIIRVRTRSTSIAAAAVFDRQLRLPMSWHKDRTQVSRMTNAMSVDLASGQASDAVITSLLDSAALVGSILGVLFVNAWVAVAIAAVLAVRAMVDLRVVRRMVVLSGLLVDNSAVDPTLELLRGVMRLRSSGALARGYAAWARYQAGTTRLRVRMGRLAISQQVLSALWPTLGLALMLSVVAVTSTGTGDGQAIGTLVTAQVALTSANTALGAAIASVGAVLSARAMLRRATPILEAVPESAGGGQVAPLRGGIDVRGVAYRYRPDLPPIFEGLDLVVQPGEHLALVGPSGSGKTTLLRLLLGLDDPESGLVAFDGRDLTGLDKAAVRRQVGAVMQSSALLPGSLRDNVDMGRGLSASDVWAALDLAAIGDDVRAMPMQLNTVVVEGSAGISGGMRQRILLARALAGEPRILILDEATSALDNVSQAAVVANLDRLRVTRIVVAHRLSTIQRADRIAVISDGRIAQQGTFEQLMAGPGPFRALADRQRLDVGPA